MTKGLEWLRKYPSWNKHADFPEERHVGAAEIPVGQQQTEKIRTTQSIVQRNPQLRGMADDCPDLTVPFRRGRLTHLTSKERQFVGRLRSRKHIACTEIETITKGTL